MWSKFFFGFKKNNFFLCFLPLLAGTYHEISNLVLPFHRIKKPQLSQKIQLKLISQMIKKKISFSRNFEKRCHVCRKLLKIKFLKKITKIPLPKCCPLDKFKQNFYIIFKERSIKLVTIFIFSKYDLNLCLCIIFPRMAILSTNVFSGAVKSVVSNSQSSFKC